MKTSLGFLTVVIPAFNEEGAVGQVVLQVRKALAKAGARHEILVVDDGSRDRTGERAKKAGARVIPMGENRGYGASLKAGFREAKGDLIAILDADGTYPPGEIPRLLVEMGNADMVVGARTKPNAAVPLLRRPAKWLLSLWANYLAERRIPDLNSGLRVFRKAVVMRYEGLFPNRFSITTTMTLALECHGFVVKYVPVEYLVRVGQSKIRPLQDTFNFFSLVLRVVMYFKPLKIFMPLSGIMMVSGLALGAWKLSTEGGVTDATTLLLVGGFQAAVLGLLADLLVKRSR